MLKYTVLLMAALSPLGCLETWTVPKEQWTSALKDAGVDPGYATDTLTKLGLVSFSFAEPQSPTLPAVFPPAVATAAELLKEEPQVSIYYAANARVRNHLWVVLNRPVHSLAEVKPEEAALLAATTNKVLGLLATKFHIPHAVVAQWNEAQPGNLADRFTIEIVPPRPETAHVLNVWDKIDSNHHVLFRGKYPPLLPAPTPEERAQDIAEWKAVLADASAFTFSEKVEGDPIEDWTQVQTHRRKAAESMLDILHASLTEKGVKIERKPDSPLAAPDEIVSPKKGCAFCRKPVIDSQKTYETELSYVFYNFKPAIPGAHFLIVPKRHIASYTGLTKEEVKDMHDLSVRLTQVLQEKFQRSDVKMYTQSGPPVGQTVPHSHMHLMLAPSPLRYIFFGLNYEQETSLTAEQMKPTLEEIGKLLHDKQSI